MKPRVAISILLIILIVLTADGAFRHLGSQSPPADPGPRGGAPGAGSFLSGLGAAEQAVFNAGSLRFQKVYSVAGTIINQSGRGLGPRFNSNACSSCHAFPAIGGSSPVVNTQIGAAQLNGATNSIPSFITPMGPMIEARFKLMPDGVTPDSSIHPAFTIVGRSDAPAGCSIAQPNFASQGSNVSLRITTPTFGEGLVENVPDNNLIAASASAATAFPGLGITFGFFNRGPVGTISHFGWKAQVDSLLTFSQQALNIEQGVTNDGNKTELEPDPMCNAGSNEPEDSTALTDTSGGSGAPTSASDVTADAQFMAMLAPPTPVASYSAGNLIFGCSATPCPVTNASIANGLAKFNQVGCSACHIQHQTTAASILTGQSNITISPFSDFALHSMGVVLADGIVQGLADGNHFRTAPLWGIGQRLFFLHDGRTSNIYQAVEAHIGVGSEANMVLGNYNALPLSDQQDVLNFLRSL